MTEQDQRTPRGFKGCGREACGEKAGFEPSSPSLLAWAGPHLPSSVFRPTSSTLFSPVFRATEPLSAYVAFP